jgi:ketosteroid isomerase-like protein
MHFSKHAMKKFCFSIALTCAMIISFAQSTDEKKIRQLLADQTVQWNSGNIPGFMQGYWHSDSLLFVGKGGPRYGFDNTLANYRKSYPDTVAMGKLQFEIRKMDPVGPAGYFVMGKWMLHRTIGNLEGYFTLLLRKINGKWMIVADHSS